MSSALFITFEGIDGSGKTTQIRLLAARFRQAGRTVLVFREPGGTTLGERIRPLLLDPDLHVDPFAELLLFSAARAQLVQEAIRPALEAGHVVICDRFFDSTTAYQGAGRHVAPLDWLFDFHHRVTGGLSPDRTYLLDVPHTSANARRLQRTEGHATPTPDRMEASGEAFYDRVIAAYADLAKTEPERILRIDGTDTAAAIHEQIWEDAHTLA